jgi:GNAT superfamily N-acetyltransferase
LGYAPSHRREHLKWITEAKRPETRKTKNPENDNDAFRQARRKDRAFEEIMTIVRAQPDDAAVLTGIAFAAKRHWGYPEKWIESWRDALTIQPEFIASHGIFAAILDGRTVGFYALGRKDHRLDLQHLWVLPDVMGRGVGRSLFLHGLERARTWGCRELEIESDPNAEGFYLHMGAHRVGVNIKELDGQRRELPVLIFEIHPVA